jgi:hypothetical protein
MRVDPRLPEVDDHLSKAILIDEEGRFIISEQSIKAIAEAVVKKLTEAEHDHRN